MKNVAGYDLARLYIGSMGTLGIISQVTLRVKPVPEEQALVTIGCSGQILGDLLDTLHASRTRPVCVEVLNAAAVRILQESLDGALPDSAWVVVVGFEHNSEAVRWQVQQLVKEISPDQGRSLNVLAGKAALPLWQAMVEFRTWPDARLTFKANLLSRATAAFCRQADERPEGLFLQAHAGNGIVLGHVAGEGGLEQAQTLVQDLLTSATAARGNLVLLRCPAAWKKTLPVWGRPGGDAWLMRRVKEAMDPREVFNPGRFLFS